tara:strand:- start:59 stop:241 length:183 start_codon:yes stop_codon:yes gene_type:complete
MHQKHPPAKYAFSKFGEFAKLVEEKRKNIINKKFFIKVAIKLIYSLPLMFYILNSIFFDI